MAQATPDRRRSPAQGAGVRGQEAARLGGLRRVRGRAADRRPQRTHRPAPAGARVRRRRRGRPGRAHPRQPARRRARRRRPVHPRSTTGSGSSPPPPHLARVQAGAGQPGPGGQMAAALRGWTRLLPHVDLTPYVGARTATWLLMAEARAALTSGDVGPANTYADAAVARAREGGLAGVDDPSRWWTPSAWPPMRTGSPGSPTTRRAALRGRGAGRRRASSDDADGSSSSARPHAPTAATSPTACWARRWRRGSPSAEPG